MKVWYILSCWPSCLFWISTYRWLVCRRAAFMCGREPNFELPEEEKEELRQYSWVEFLAKTRIAISSKSNSLPLLYLPSSEFSYPIHCKSSNLILICFTYQSSELHRRISVSNKKMLETSERSGYPGLEGSDLSASENSANWLGKGNIQTYQLQYTGLSNEIYSIYEKLLFFPCIISCDNSK